MSQFDFSRRRLLGATALVAGAALLPGPAQAHLLGAGAARWVRTDLATDRGAQMLASYTKAIKAMLALPYDDARNWYRNALIHTMDCPHGNWWFVVWHRGYIGNFEEVARDLSGDSSFAIPFWDWTKQPLVPATFWEGLLNPSTPGFIADADTFKARLLPPMQAYYKTLNNTQLGQLAQRTLDPTIGALNTAENLIATAASMYFPSAGARALTLAAPNFDKHTAATVELSVIQAALKPKDFLTFGSGKAPQHSGSATQGILESQPHNNVHNCVGGFMGEFVSPADPIFFVHHSNIDRLWNTWTTKQVAAGLPTLPTGADLAPWTNEPFAFFHDAAGRGLPDVIAGDYATIGDFDYAYTPGSGDAPPAAPIVAMADLAPVKATKLMGAFAANKAGSGTLAVAPERLTAAAQLGATSDIYAVIEVKVPADAMRVQFAVFVNAPPNKVGALDATSPSYAGAFQLHGGHAHTPTMRFIVDLSGALEKLAAAKLLSPGKPLNVAVVPRDLDGAKRSLAGELVSVEIRSF